MRMHITTLVQPLLGVLAVCLSMGPSAAYESFIGSELCSALPQLPAGMACKAGSHSDLALQPGSQGELGMS